MDRINESMLRWYDYVKRMHENRMVKSMFRRKLMGVGKKIG